MKLIFLTREGGKERNVEVGKIASQNIDEQEMGLQKGSAKCRPIAMGKKKTLWNGKFWVILKVSNLMTYE